MANFQEHTATSSEWSSKQNEKKKTQKAFKFMEWGYYKKKAYLRYLTTRSETDKLEYKRLVAIVKRETRKIKRQCWEIFVSRIEHDLHGRQINVYKIIRN